mgnify:CR=1 FL=1
MKISFNRLVFALQVALIVATCHASPVMTIWRNTELWFTTAQEHAITTGLIEIIGQINDEGGFKAYIGNKLYESIARQMYAYMRTLPDFKEVTAPGNDSASLRLQALQHFCPDFNIPADVEHLNGSTSDAALAFLDINQDLDVCRAAPYVKALLVLISVGR